MAACGHSFWTADRKRNTKLRTEAIGALWDPPGQLMGDRPLSWDPPVLHDRPWVTLVSTDRESAKNPPHAAAVTADHWWMVSIPTRFFSGRGWWANCACCLLLPLACGWRPNTTTTCLVATVQPTVLAIGLAVLAIGPATTVHSIAPATTQHTWCGCTSALRFRTKLEACGQAINVSHKACLSNLVPRFRFNSCGKPVFF